MGLIDVPKSKEEIAQYLADGNVRPAPFVTQADISDGEILGATQTTDLGGGSYKFSITLPSGRYLESAPIGPDYSKRDATIQWVGAVGSAIIGDASDAAEATYEAARKREPIEPIPDSYQPGGMAGSPTGTYTGAGTAERGHSSDPATYAREQLSAALARLAAVANAEADVERWQKVVDAFSGVSSKPKKRRRKKRAPKSP